MATLEEMTLTFIHAKPGTGDSVKDGLLAVLEKHVGPMLKTAFVAGGRVKDCASHRAILADDYAARILAQLTKQNERVG